jgi:hypothetical protein
MKKKMYLLVTAVWMCVGISLAQRPEAGMVRLAISGKLNEVKGKTTQSKQPKAVKKVLPTPNGTHVVSLDGFDYIEYLTTGVWIWDKTYSEEGKKTIWSNYYVPLETEDGYIFDHYSAGQTKEKPYIYDYWDGFTLSEGDSVPDGDLDKQFSAVTDTDTFIPYLVAYYSYNEYFYWEKNCNVKFPEEKTPVGAYFTNNEYALTSMKNGDSFARKFGPGDSLTLKIFGYNAGSLVDSISFNLAKYNTATTSLDYVDEWEWVSLQALGLVDSLSFELYTTDTGVYGPNTPTYFCMAGLTVTDSTDALAENGGNNLLPPAVAQPENAGNGIAVYPNPATSEITLNAGEGSLVEIFDLAGNLKDARIFKTEQETISITNLKDGLYTVQITSGNKVERTKFYKK